MDWEGLTTRNPELGTVVPGRTWDDVREEVADVMIAAVNGFAPNFAGSVLGRRILSPLDEGLFLLG